MTRFSEIKDEYLEDEDWEDIALILKDAMYRLEDEGWCQGHFVEQVQTGGRRYCAVGSVMAAVAARQEEPTHPEECKNMELVNGIQKLLDEQAKQYFLLRSYDDVVSFNDNNATRLEDVLGVFSQTLDKVRKELGY
jgi:hypothetical protein